MNLDRRTLLTGAALSLAAGTAAYQSNGSLITPVSAASVEDLPRVKQEMVVPPLVPDHDQVAIGGPKIVEVRFEIEEKKLVIDDDGTEVWALTFNGSVPGPMIVVHEGDYIELTLVNPESSVFMHNIDFHAATGALGGAELTKVEPGEEAILRFKAVRTGVFVYHCAPGGDMIPYHVVHGMNGAVMVLPRNGLTDDKGHPVRYDKVYYIGEQDFYIPRDEDGEFKKYEGAGDNYADAMEVMKGLVPTHVVFNGKVGSLTGDNAMTAKNHESVLFIHAQANRDTRPHLIGGHGDYVWESGAFLAAPVRDLETWFIRGGSAGAAICSFHQPGLYVYINHNLIEGVLLGAAAHVKVEGEWDEDLMTQVKKPTAI